MSLIDCEHRRAVIGHACKLLSLTPCMASDLERGIFNWSVRQADTYRVKSLSKFLALYESKARSVLTNLDPTSYIGNPGLLEKVQSGEIVPHDIPFMKPQDMFPTRWQTVLEMKKQRDEYAATAKPVAMSSQFWCRKCNKNECIYQELQLRSADESTTVIVTCILCRSTWRIG